jgi:hypothetical protein
VRFVVGTIPTLDHADYPAMSKEKFGKMTQELITKFLGLVYAQLIAGAVTPPPPPPPPPQTNTIK